MRSEQKSRGLLFSIALVELAFAADMLAALAITDMLFVLVSASLLATAAMRSLSRTVMLYAPRIKPLRTATLMLLALAGASLVARTQYYVSPLTSFLVVAGTLGAGVILSLRKNTPRPASFGA